MLKAYRDTYRIVAPVSQYVSYCEVPVSFHPLLPSFANIH